MKDVPFAFYKTQMRIRVTTPETRDFSSLGYCVIEMTHVPNVGPALHIHLRGPETFIVLEGTYTFFLGESDETLTATTLHAGQSFTAPAGVGHRYLVGDTPGRLLVICPPDLENYFWEVAQSLQSDTPLTREAEFAIAHRYGQDFVQSVNDAPHWGHK
jgi:mannose-6-phosphate isomerase-like protein (cupin superfamily)